MKPPAVMLRDYHMHLVAGMTRELLPDALIQYVIDVPWPEPGDWMFLPRQWRDDIFRSLLRCDVLGFGTDADARSFLRCVSEFVPGAAVDGRSVVYERHTLQVRTYRPGVNEEALAATVRSPRAETAASELAAPRGVHTFLTAERAEPHKNIVRCIRAYGTLLSKQPALAASTRYLLVLAPPPPHLSLYRRYVSEVEQAAQEVNRAHGKGGWQPVQLCIENNYPKALAAMRDCDTLVAAPLADALCTTALGTPLLSRGDCSLIISETSGAAEVFGNAAHVVSPSDVEGIAQEMGRAVSLSLEERRACFAAMEAASLAVSPESWLEQQATDLLALAE
jgi:trehalose 6-phosphate synthase